MFKSLKRYSVPSFLLVGTLALAGCGKSEQAAATGTESVQTNVEQAQPAANKAESQGSVRTLDSEIVPVTVAGAKVASGLAPVSSTLPSTPVSSRAASSVLSATPSIVNLGKMATNETKTGIVTLANISDRHITIERAKTSCGCTTAGLDPGTVLAPGETIDVSISLRGGSRAQTLRKTVSFLVAGMDPLIVSVRGQAIEYVTMQPANLDRNTNPDGIITLRSIDNVPFRVTGMSPPLLAANELPQESNTVQEIRFPWTKLDEYGLTRRITFHLDHPKAQSVFTTIKVDNSQVLSNNRNLNLSNTVRGAGNAAPRTGIALIEQMFQQKDTEGVLKRLEEGLSLETKDRSGMTILSLACRYAEGAFVQTLIERGADIESQDNAGRTPLMTASQFSNLEAMQTLIDVGARINARDRIGNTPLSWASGFGSPTCVGELIQSGADIEAVSNVTGWTPLIWAAGFGDPVSVQVLVAAGANLEVGDIMQGATPLIHAARTGKYESMDILLKAGANIETKDRNGKTALLAACENSGGTADKVKLLLDADTDILVTDNRGKNALQLARARTDPRAPAVVALLTPLLSESTQEAK